MLSSTVDKQGIKVADRGNKALEMDVVRLLKTQDVGYLRTMLQVVRKQVRELEEKIVVEEDGVRTVGGKEGDGQHTVFVGDKKEQRKYKPDEWFGTAPRKEVNIAHDSDDDADEGGAQPKKLSKKQQEKIELVEKEKGLLMQKREKSQEKMARELKTLKQKERALAMAEERLDNQRAKMNSTVGGTNKAGVKFKLRERKK